MIAGTFEARVLQANTLELRRPDREVRCVVNGTFDTGVDALRPVEQEAEIKAAGEPCFDITVQAKSITALERERFVTDCIFGKAANRPVLVVVEEFGAPRETLIGGLTEGSITVG